LATASTQAAVTVAIMSAEPLVAEGAAAYLRTCPGIKPVPPDCLDRASVVLVIASEVGEQTLAVLQRAAELTPGRETRFVLVCDGIREPQLLRALTWGVVSVLPRQDASYERIARALTDARDGRVEFPPDVHGWLERFIRSIQQDVLAPHGLTEAGFYTREVDVLRLLAEGMDTLEIAHNLSYSERTVRSIIHGLITRMNLRNRTHAVAYSVRRGVI
jgi:DNA-binding NarL/FixJ family response regulator